MNLPNRITVFRIILSPVFFVFFFLPRWLSVSGVWLIPVLWVLFLVSELSDFFDGYFARKLNLVTDIGKIMDPFSDVVSRMTFFVCFTATGLMPVWILMILLYREFGILFLRMFMMGRGTAMAASIWGKAKAITYVLAAGFGLLTMSLRYLGLSAADSSVWNLVLLLLFVLTAVSSVFSFLTYALAVRRSVSNGQ